MARGVSVAGGVSPVSPKNGSTPGDGVIAPRTSSSVMFSSDNFCDSANGNTMSGGKYISFTGIDLTNRFSKPWSRI